MTPTSFNAAQAIAPSNSEDFPKLGQRTLCNAIFVGTGGTVRVVFNNDMTADFVAADGTYLLVSAKRVNASGTDADDLLALYFI